MTDGVFESLGAMTVVELRSEWRRIYKTAPPLSYTPDLLLRGLSYRLQEKALGKLPIEHRRELDQLAGLGAKPVPKGKSTPLRPGSRLVRRWRGTTYNVAVLDGWFEFQSRRYTSLSVIAREITGTRWSGPRFFGCRP